MVSLRNSGRVYRRKTPRFNGEFFVIMKLMFFWISLGILVFVFLIQFANFFYFEKNLGKFSRILFFSAIAGILIYYFYLTYAQYQLWKNSNDFTKYLVPPYKSITYVIGYHFMRFALYYAIALALALIFLWVAKHHNKKFGGRFFEPEEPYFGALAIFLLGNGEWHYAWITYFVFLLVFSAIGTAVYTKILKKNERFPIYWLWFPIAIFVIVIMKLGLLKI